MNIIKNIAKIKLSCIKDSIHFLYFMHAHIVEIIITPLDDLSLYKVKTIIRLSARTFDVTIRTTDGHRANCHHAVMVDKGFQRHK